MKYIAYTLLLGGLLTLHSCGWSDNQKQAARTSIGEGFDEGLESNGATVDPKVRELWLDCVVEKASKDWSFKEFSKGGPALEAIQKECAEEVGLFDAITVE